MQSGSSKRATPEAGKAKWMGNKGRAASKRLKTIVRQQGEKETKAWRTHSPNVKDESLAPNEVVADMGEAPKRNPSITKEIAAIHQKRKETLKAAKARVAQRKAQVPKKLAKLAKRMPRREQSAVFQDCLQQLESFTLKPKEPAKFVGLDVPKSRYLVKGKASGK